MKIGDGEPIVNAAVLSSMAYDNDTSGLLRSLGIKYDDPEDGFGAVPYKTEGGYMPAFLGTDGGSDLGSNIRQAAGLKASQYEQAIDLAEQVYAVTGGNVTMIGHSPGGGLASAASHATGAPGVTFNAAGLHPRYRTGNDGGIRAHHMAGDPLNTVQDSRWYLPSAAGTRIRHAYPGSGVDLGGRHSIATFLDL